MLFSFKGKYMINEQKSIQDKILDEALALFAEKGYANTSIREITKRSNVNVASVNYYFRDKMKLYEAVIKREFDNVIENFQPKNTTNLQDWLKSWYKELLDAPDALINSSFSKLMKHEENYPSGIGKELFVDIIKPRHEKLVELVSLYIEDVSENKKMSRRIAKTLHDISKSYVKDRELFMKLEPILFESENWKNEALQELISTANTILNAYKK